MHCVELVSAQFHVDGVLVSVYMTMVMLKEFLGASHLDVFAR